MLDKADCSDRYGEKLKYLLEVSSDNFHMMLSAADTGSVSSIDEKLKIRQLFYPFYWKIKLQINKAEKRLFSIAYKISLSPRIKTNLFVIRASRWRCASFQGYQFWNFICTSLNTLHIFVVSIFKIAHALITF